MRSILTISSLIPLCFIGGWLIGTVDSAAIKKAIVDSYMNRYITASGANSDEVIYYVVSDDPAALEEIASSDKNIRRIERSDLPRLFNAHLSYTERRQSLKTLRAHESISAVFTIPLICH